MKRSSPVLENMPETIRVEREGALATVILDNPSRRNAIDAAMWQRLREVMQSLSGDLDLRCVVLRGAGEDAFAAGGDRRMVRRNSAQAGAPGAAQIAEAFGYLATEDYREGIAAFLAKRALRFRGRRIPPFCRMRAAPRLDALTGLPVFCIHDKGYKVSR